MHSSETISINTEAIKRTMPIAVSDQVEYAKIFSYGPRNFPRIFCQLKLTGCQLFLSWIRIKKLELDAGKDYFFL
jgi:hypothetical protein